MKPWLAVTLVIATGVVILGMMLLIYVPFDDLRLGFQLDAAVPALASSPDQFEQAAVRYEQADPAADAAKAINAGDMRLWAVKSHDGFFVPGGLDGKVAYYQQRYGLRFWQAGVASHSDSEVRFQRAIDGYAERYNTAMLGALQR